MTTPSWMLTLLPMRMLLTSPRMTALNQMLVSSPISTSPTTVALGATKQLFPNFGNLPSTGRIVAMAMLLVYVNILKFFLRTLLLMSFNSNEEKAFPPGVDSFPGGGMDVRQLFLRHVAQTSPSPLGIEIARA